MTEASRDRLRKLGITSPESLARWARSKGMLSAYIQFTPRDGFIPAHWSVIRPGYPTASQPGPAWQRKNQTFVCRDAVEKNVMEERAKTWAAMKFGVDVWWRIEGMGGTLFPKPVLSLLTSYVPGVKLYSRRQHS